MCSALVSCWLYYMQNSGLCKSSGVIRPASASRYVSPSVGAMLVPSSTGKPWGVVVRLVLDTHLCKIPSACGWQRPLMTRRHGEHLLRRVSSRELALAYGGTPLRRPTACNEVMWLARLLVRAWLPNCFSTSPSAQALKLGNPLALGYSGPPLRRPIASNEVMWLARLLVRMSDAADSALGLDQPPTEAEQHRDGALQVTKLASLPRYM
jgi:hypothetical protein